MAIKDKIKNFINEWKRRRFNKHLIKRYPFLKMEYVKNYDTTWYDNIPDGWKKISLVYFEKIRTILIQHNYLEYLKFSDVKEKWGSLRIYTYYPNCPGNEHNSWIADIDRLISRLEHDTWRLCIHCGKPAAYQTKGWISPVCKFCKESQEYVYPNVEFEDWKDWE